MHKATLQFPAKMDLASVLGFAKEIDYFANHDRVTIDFGQQHFFSPFNMLFIGAKLANFRKKNASVRLDFRNHAGHTYAAHMGFFRLCGMDFGRELGENHEGSDYLSIACLDRDSFYVKPSDKYEELPDLIQRHANKLAAVVARGGEKDRNLYDVLSYSIREVMRNVFEHSGSESLHYCAQFWPTTNKIEFAIADFGIGIRRGLGTNPNFRFATDKQAIEYSLLPSVSGRTHLPRSSNTWFNSGYGLYMTNRLARNGGNFVLASGQTAIHLSKKTKTNHATSFPGTVLRFNMDINQIGDVKDRLEEFRKDGTEIAKTIAGSGNRPPSAMSLLLRRDYSPAKA